MEPVKATRLADNEELFDKEIDGSFVMREGRILCVCPCGCGTHMHLRIHKEGEDGETGGPAGSGPSWKWDGNLDTPTLQPSIRDISGCRFHGHLTAGVWTFEGDSGVK